jgi:PST family polysaccharide transporter
MNAPDAVGVVRLMCFAVVLDGIAMTPWGVLNRFFLQKRLFVGEAVMFVSTTAVTIGLALAGTGAYAFAWGTVVGHACLAASHLCLAPVRVWPGWDRRVVRPLLSFGLPLAGASLLALSVINVDNIVVGSVLGQTMLGYYLLAVRQSNWLLLFSDAARRVALAGFSRLVDDRELLSRAFERGLALLMAATIPAAVLLAAYAGPLVRFLYGERWDLAAQALPLLAAFGVVRIGLTVAYDLFVALGRSRLLAGLQFLWLLALGPALALGARVDGIRGAAAAHALVAAIVVTPVFLAVLRRVGVGPGRALAACLRPALGGMAIGLVAWGVTATVEGDLARLLCAGLSVVVVYGPIVWPMRSLLPARSAPGPLATVPGSPVDSSA